MSGIIGKGTGHATERLYECFKQIDTDGSGEITGSELVQLFLNLGDCEDLAKKNAKEFLNLLDKNYDNKISWEEFKKGMRD